MRRVWSDIGEDASKAQRTNIAEGMKKSSKKGALWIRGGLDQTRVACIVRNFMSSYFLHVDTFFSHMCSFIYLLFLQIVFFFVFCFNICFVYSRIFVFRVFFFWCLT